MLAAINGHYEIIRLLIEAGAKVDSRNKVMNNMIY